METINCLECGLQFESRRSLHAHIKVHELSLGEYYVKHFPKYDLLTGEPIPFKNLDNYLLTDFRHKKNMNRWLKEVSQDRREYYCREAFAKHMRGREYAFAPNYLYFLTHPRLPRAEFFNQAWLDEDLQKFGCKKVFIHSIPECPDFLDIPSDLCIMQDTREQMPLSFSCKTLVNKLDFGDYTASGPHFSSVFVDRKSEDDFKGTMTQGFERFTRELDRTKELNCYLFIVVESDFAQMFHNNNLLFKKKTNLTYVLENMRKIIVAYSDVCQFIFTGSRENSSTVIPYILVNGEKFKGVDLQYYLEKYSCLG